MAKRAKVGLSTLKDFEAGKRAPMRNNLDALRRAIEAAGVRLVFSDDQKAAGISVEHTRGE